MLGWGKKKQDDDRAALVKEAREMLGGMKRNWDVPTHMTFAVLLANVWREFELTHGSPGAFAKLPDNVKSAYVTALVQRSVQLHSELERLNTQRAAKGVLTDALCGWAAARLLSFYMLAVMTNDKEWETELGPVLDDYMVKGYKTSWGACPLPGEERLDRSKHGVQPIARFTR
jgi:hypothetical protein